MYGRIFIPAEPQYFAMYADAKREALKGKLAHREGSLTHLRVGNIPLPEPRSESFEPVTTSQYHVSRSAFPGALLR